MTDKNNEGSQRPLTAEELARILPNKIEIRQKSNGFGTAGFALAILAIVVALFSMIPFAIVICAPIAFALCLLGAIFSILGLLKRPRGMAVAGIIISVVGFFVTLFIVLTVNTFVEKVQTSVSNLFNWG